MRQKSILNIAIFLGAIFLLTALFSCKKKQDKVPAVNYTRVKYKIDPISNIFARISYNDEKGNVVDELDWAKFIDGERTVNVSTLPFDAKIQTVIYNPNNNTMYYNLMIFVNDSIKGYKNCSAPPQVTGYTTELTYTVK